MNHETPDFFKTDITPEQRASFREMMASVTYKPKNAHDAKTAECMTTLARALAAQWPDETIDTMILNVREQTLYSLLSAPSLPAAPK